MTRLVEGDVVRLRCRSCGAITHEVVFSGENDTVTWGLISLCSIAGPEVVIAEALEGELGSGFHEAGLSTQRRVSTALGRDDLRFAPFLRAEDQEPAAKMSLQAFRSAYQPPRLVFACPHCAAGEAASEATQSFANFERDGGKLTPVGDLSLAC